MQITRCSQGRSQNPFKNIRMVKTRWKDHVAKDAVRFGTECEYPTEEALVPLLEGITGTVKTRTTHS